MCFTGGELKWASEGQKRGQGPGEINEKAHQVFQTKCKRNCEKFMFNFEKVCFNFYDNYINFNQYYTTFWIIMTNVINKLNM